ncbi:MAG: hypothetical protein ABGY71_13890 [bacterium]|jgi:hypothetical protein|nr:hypothetical protein [Planctomycetota bacterium]HIL50784.1 hypothetical protein [Planctomycetota bacterium]
MRLPLNLLLGLLLALPACGPSSDPDAAVDAGYTALNKGQAAAALAEFDTALKALQPTDQRYLEAKLGQLRARCFLDPMGAQADFLALGSSTSLQPGDYRMLVSDLVTAASAQTKADSDAAKATIGSAVAILQAGAAAFPEDEKWPTMIKIVGDKAASLGAEDALAGLSGLGYVGGD